MDRPKVYLTQYTLTRLQGGRSLNNCSMEGKETAGRSHVENEPAVTKMAEMDCRPRKQHRKRDPLANYNKSPVPKLPSPENQSDGPSDKPKKRRDPLADYNKPPVPRSPDAETKRTRPNPLAKPKPTTAAGEKNDQAGSSNEPGCSKKVATSTVGEKGRVVGKANAAGAKSKRITEGLNNTTPSTSYPSIEHDYQSPSCRGETTFLCFFCSKTKDVKDRYPDRTNTCTQCHAYYMTQVASG